MNRFMHGVSMLCVLNVLFTFGATLKAELATVPFKYTFSGASREEMFYGSNISLLNNNNTSDKIFYARHYLDLMLDVIVPAARAECPPPVELYFSIRNKAIWGDPNSIASTASTTIKFVDSILGPHSHYIPRQLFWIREAWISCELDPLLAISWTPHATVTLGAFPFQVGRGISLGDAYAVGPELLGFYTENTVDQYAFGAKLSTDILVDTLTHDFYVAILNSKTSTLGQTAEKILSQQFGHRLNPIRGFGVINYVVAGRFLWKAFDTRVLGKLELEPYWVYNDDPEQTVQFLADASSKLGTLGLAGEYVHDQFAFGFDCAFNVGRQKVKSWDRNDVVIENRDARSSFVNSQIIDQATGKRIPFVSSSSPVQTAIYESFNSEFSQFKNGQVITIAESPIGFLPADPDNPVLIQNSNIRFRDPYKNVYKGWMFVADAGWFTCKKQVQIAATFGVASGDENPNIITKDGTYSGFLSLQEIYSGKRVRSAFVLGGRVRRPLSVPSEEEAPSMFADNVSGFTNIVFCGASMNWKPTGFAKPFSFNPNVLAYWQEKPTKKFDARSRRQLRELASSFLGVEANLFANYFPLEPLRLYFVGSVFIPGQHYTDIKGLPLTADQNRALNELNQSGFNRTRIPNIGDNVAYTFNIGMEFKF